MEKKDSEIIVTVYKRMNFQCSQEMIQVELYRLK